MKRLFLAVMLISICMHSNLFSQENKAGKQSSPIITDDLNPLLKSPVTLVAKDASLSEVLRALSERSGMNFVSGEGVNRQKITIMLNKTPLDEAINLLVRAAGLSYEIIGNSVLIAEPENLQNEVGLSAYVVELKYANAVEVAEMLSDLTGNIQVDKGGNKLICFTSPRVMLEVERIVRSIDKPHILVMLETRLIEVSMEKNNHYGINWGNLSPIETGISYPESPLSDRLSGENWIQMPLNFNITLDMLIQNGDATILMDSKLTTTNNREASLHIGEVVPYLVQTYNLSAAGGVNMQVQKEEVGVMITMTPHINNDDQITLVLEPEVSNIVGFVGPQADLPMVRVRKTSTTVRVEDGQKIFLAGLLSDEETSSIRKLPVLGSIPIIGLLFQNRKTVSLKKNLIIEVVPHIIKDPADIARLLRASAIEDQKRTADAQEAAASQALPAEEVAEPKSTEEKHVPAKTVEEKATEPAAPEAVPVKQEETSQVEALPAAVPAGGEEAVESVEP